VLICGMRLPFEGVGTPLAEASEPAGNPAGSQKGLANSGEVAEAQNCHMLGFGLTNHTVQTPRRLPPGGFACLGGNSPKNRDLARQNTRCSCKHDGNLRRWQSGKDRNVAGVAIPPHSPGSGQKSRWMATEWPLTGSGRGKDRETSAPLPRPSERHGQGN
jgi:hypothetical protein